MQKKLDGTGKEESIVICFLIGLVAVVGKKRGRCYVVVIVTANIGRIIDGGIDDLGNNFVARNNGRKVHGGLGDGRSLLGNIGGFDVFVVDFLIVAFILILVIVSHLLGGDDDSSQDEEGATANDDDEWKSEGGIVGSISTGGSVAAGYQFNNFGVHIVWDTIGQDGTVAILGG